MWTYEYDEEIRDLECKTREEAERIADEWFAYYCQDIHDDLRNGDNFDDEIILIEFDFDDEGERKEKQRLPAVVEYTHYHGDYAEHFSQSDYI